jgi:glycosyltransferase involved in cell wall biosynthesis
VRRWVPSKDFTGLLSLGILRRLRVEVANAQIVHIAFAREAIPIVALLIALVLGKRVVLQPHGMLTSRSSRMHDWVDLALRPFLRRADVWIALTDSEAEALMRRYRRTIRSIRVIDNPVPFTTTRAEVLRHTVRRRQALFVGRLHPRKRVEDFVAAAEIAHANGWADRYEIVGPDQGSLAGIVERIARLPHLEYEGPIRGEEVPTVIAESEVLVLPSENEPWGQTVAIALALGIACVITESAALAPRIRPYANVEVVPDGDPASIARAVHRMLAQPDRPMVATTSRSQEFKRENAGSTLLQTYLEQTR